MAHCIQHPPKEDCILPDKFKDKLIKLFHDRILHSRVVEVDLGKSVYFQMLFCFPGKIHLHLLFHIHIIQIWLTVLSNVICHKNLFKLLLRTLRSGIQKLFFAFKNLILNFSKSLVFPCSCI
jgi:hypothetical protein